MGFLDDAIRSLFWGIGKLVLIVSDWQYEALESIVGLDLSSSKALLYTWSFFLLFIVFATMLRVACIVFQKTSNPESDFDLTDLPKKIIYIFLAISISTTCFFFVLGMPGQIASIYSKTIVYDEKMSPSTAVISATAKTPLSSSLEDMQSTDEVVDIETIDKKLNKEEDGDYIYFLGLSELLLCIMGGFVVMCLQLNIVVDTGTRLILNIFRFVIGFIPISSIVEKESTFGEWCRDILSDSLTIAFNLIATQLCFGLMSTTIITNLNGILRIILFATGLCAVCKIGEIVAKYLGASNLSGGGRLGSMLLGAGAFQAVRMAGKVGSKAVNSVLGHAVSNQGNAYRNMGSQMAGSTGQGKNPFHGLGGSGGGSPLNPTSPLTPNFDPKTGEILNASQNPSGFVGYASRGSSSIYQGGDSVLDTNPMSTMSKISMGGTALSMAGRMGSGMFGQRSVMKTMPKQQAKVSRYPQQDKKIPQTKEISKTEQQKQQYKSKINDRKTNYGRGGTSFVENKTRGHLYRGSEMRYKQSAKEMYQDRKRTTMSMEN